MNFIDILLKIVFNQYFSSSRCVFLITDQSSVQLSLPSRVSTISISVNYNDISADTSSVSETLFQNHGCQVFIFSVQHPALVLSIVERGIKTQNESFFNRKYIFIDNGHSVKDFVSEVFKTLEIHFVCNMLVISLDNQVINLKRNILQTYQEIYGIWSHTYTGPNKTLYLDLIDKWSSSNESFLTHTNLFPNKLEHSFGRIYRLGFFTYLPYIFYEQEKETNNIKLEGLEGTIITEFFKKTNLSFEPVLVQKDYWGDVFDNGSAYGLRGLLYEDKIDIAIAANFPTDRMCRYYGVTLPILRIGITCLVPAPKLVPSWLTPIYVYSRLLWKMIFMGYFVVLGSVYIIQLVRQFTTFKKLRSNKYQVKFKKCGEIFFTVFTHNFGSNNFLKGYSETIFLIVTLFVTFFLYRSYESGLASIMTSPSYQDSIETAEDFLRSNISWGGIQEADFIKHWEKDEGEEYRRAFNRYLAAPSETMLKNRLSAGNFGLLIERISTDHFHFPFPPLETSKEITLMKEDIHWEFTTFFLRKSSSLIPLLNTFILAVKETGLIDYWLDQAEAKGLDQGDQIEVKYLSQHYKYANHKAVQLKLDDVAGAFGIVVIGNLIALLVFTVELLCYKKCNSKNKQSS